MPDRNRFAAEITELLEVYRAHGFAAADRRAGEIVTARGLAAHEALSLADGFRRRALYA